MHPFIPGIPDFQGVPGPGPGFGDTVVIKTKPCLQGTCLLISITGTVCLKDTPTGERCQRPMLASLGAGAPRQVRGAEGPWPQLGACGLR